MAEILLQDVVQDMRAHLRAGRLSSALDLGRHILQFFPKHVETYSVLAQVCLKSGDLANAQDLLRRVMSADPENVVALAGMALISEGQEKSDEALWYLERAYEIAPSNDELRGELLRLREQFYGTAPSRIELTSGALARVYARQGQYPQAINEFRRLLRSDSKRYDVRVALAEVLYRAGRSDEAAQTAQQIMADAPYSLKPNLILGALWTENQVPEGQQFLQRAHQLDPEHRIARDLLGEKFDGAQAPRLPEFGGRAASTIDAQTSEPFDSFETNSDAARAAALLSEIERAQEPVFEEPLFADQAAIERVERETVPTIQEPTAPSPIDAVLAATVVAQAVESTATPKPPLSSTDDATLKDIAAAQDSDASPPPPTTAPTPSPQRVNKSNLDTDAIAVAAAALATSIALDKTKQPSPALRAHPALPKVRPVIASAQGTLPPWLYISAPPANAPASFDEPKSDRPDWLVQAQVANQQEQVTKQEDAALPDWLKPTAAAVASAAVVSETNKSSEPELPQWLRDDSAVTTSAGQQDVTAEPIIAPSTNEPIAAELIPVISGSPQAGLPNVAGAGAAAIAVPIETEPKPVNELVASPMLEPEQPLTPIQAGEETTPAASIAAVEPISQSPESPAPTVHNPTPVVVDAPQPAERGATQAQPDSATMLQMARDKRASGDLKGALDLYERVMHRRPNYLDQVTGDLEEIVKNDAPRTANRLLGEAYVMAGRYKESLEQTRIAMGKSPK